MLRTHSANKKNFKSMSIKCDMIVMSNKIAMSIFWTGEMLGFHFCNWKTRFLNNQIESSGSFLPMADDDSQKDYKKSLLDVALKRQKFVKCLASK